MVLSFLILQTQNSPNFNLTVSVVQEMKPYWFAHPLCDQFCVFVVCSFHVGSGAQSSTAYANALALAKDVFITAVSISLVRERPVDCRKKRM